MCLRQMFQKAAGAWGVRVRCTASAAAAAASAQECVCMDRSAMQCCAAGSVVQIDRLRYVRVLTYRVSRSRTDGADLLRGEACCVSVWP